VLTVLGVLRPPILPWEGEHWSKGVTAPRPGWVPDPLSSRYEASTAKDWAELPHLGTWVDLSRIRGT